MHCSHVNMDIHDITSAPSEIDLCALLNLRMLGLQHSIYGYNLSNSVEGSIRLRFSKYPLGVRLTPANRGSPIPDTSQTARHAHSGLQQHTARHSSAAFTPQPMRRAQPRPPPEVGSGLFLLFLWWNMLVFFPSFGSLALHMCHASVKKGGGEHKKNEGAYVASSTVFTCHVVWTIHCEIFFLLCFQLSYLALIGS